MKYPLIEAMDLKVIYNYDSDDDIYFVKADDLEKALQAAPLWYGDKDLDSWSTVKVWADTTHTARLVCIQPIKTKYSKAERIVEFVKEYSLAGNIKSSVEFNKAIERILEDED